MVEEDESGDQMEGEGKPSESDQDDPLDEEVCSGRESIYRQPMRRSDVEEAEAEAEEMTRRKVVSPSQVIHKWCTLYQPSVVAPPHSKDLGTKRV